MLITTKGDKTYMGFVSEESAEKLVIRDIAGQVNTIKVADTHFAQGNGNLDDASGLSE